MKAFLLSAGLGSRLKPITNTIPKCLVQIAGHPMLDWWGKLLKENGVQEVLVNTHYLHKKVHEYIQEFNERETDIKFIEFYEPDLLGSGGTIRENKEFVKNEPNFLICYADNLCNVNLKNLIEFHLQKKGLLTMALFRTDSPEQCGIAEMNNEGEIVEFIEKPQFPKGNLANAGLYVVNSQIFSFFPEEGFTDFGKDILPGLIGQMYGWEINDYLIDIGTMSNYEKAKREWNYDYNKDTLSR